MTPRNNLGGIVETMQKYRLTEQIIISVQSFLLSEAK